MRLGLLLVILLGGGCVGPIQKSWKEATDAPGISIYLVNQGWHTDLMVPKAAVAESLWPEKNDFPDADYLVISWGDWDFYQAPENDLWMTFKAVAWPTNSVLHVVGFSGSVNQKYPDSEIIEVKLSAQAFRYLCCYIHDSFLREGSRAEPIHSEYYPSSPFYPAQGNFHLFRTCNAWTASALRAAGIPINPLSALFAGTLMSQLRKFGQPIR